MRTEELPHVNILKTCKCQFSRLWLLIPDKGSSVKKECKDVSHRVVSLSAVVI